MQKPLVQKTALLQKFPGKGGWTYVELPEVTPDKNAHFGLIRVKGTIDGIPINRYHIMPLGNGNMFLPVNASIRKEIKKEAGDKITILLFKDDSALEIPQELLESLETEPAALEKFVALKDRDKEEFTKWIFAAKKVETRAERIVATINKLLAG